MFVSLTGKVGAEFPASTISWVRVPRRCLLDAGGMSEPSAHTAFVGAASRVLFWLWRRINPLRHAIVTAFQLQISRVSRGRRACPLSPGLARRKGPLSVGFRPWSMPRVNAGYAARMSPFTHGSESNTSDREEAHKSYDLAREAASTAWACSAARWCRIRLNKSIFRSYYSP